MVWAELASINPGLILTVHFNDGSIYCPDNDNTFLTIQEDGVDKFGIAAWRPTDSVPARTAFWQPKDISKLGLRI